MTRAEKKEELRRRNAEREERWMRLVRESMQKGVKFLPAMSEAERDCAREMLAAPERGTEITGAWNEFVKRVKKIVAEVAVKRGISDKN